MSTLCPVCLSANADDARERCESCGAGLELRGRFRIARVLASKSKSRTYLARDRRADGEAAFVVIKELSLIQLDEWKDLELFERGAKVLRGLDHPGVPRFVDEWSELRGGVTVYFMAQEFVPGQSLAEALEAGRRFDEAAARRIAASMLETLAYLHAQSPPIIHRDVKPGNIVERAVGGECVLVDFDLVRDEARPGGGSTTAIGTVGYAPLEQLMGRAVPATDLFALGATLIALLSRRDPADLFDPSSHRLDFRDYVNVSPRFAAVLERMTAPSLDERYASAGEVLRALESAAALALPARSEPDEAALVPTSEAALTVPEGDRPAPLVEFLDDFALARPVEAPKWIPALVLGSSALALGLVWTFGWSMWVAFAVLMTTLMVLRHPVEVGADEALHHGVTGNSRDTTVRIRWNLIGNAQRISLHAFCLEYEPAPTPFAEGLVLRMRLRLRLRVAVDDEGEAKFDALLKLGSWQQFPTTMAEELRENVLTAIVASLVARPRSLIALQDGDPTSASESVDVIVREKLGEKGLRVEGVEIDALGVSEDRDGVGGADRIVLGP